MNKENTEKLWKKYPNLYSGKDKSIRESLIPFGFEHGDGWYDIIDELSAKLEKLGCVADQVKEKFGGLRFYYHPWTDESRRAVEKAEKKSWETCEECGNPGEVRGGSWIKVLCDECNRKRKGC